MLLASGGESLAGKTNFTSGVLAGINLYDDLAGLMADGPPVVCHVDCKHPNTMRAAIKEGPKSKHIVYLVRLKALVEKLTGLPCATVHYTQLTGASLNEKRIKALIITVMDKSLDDKFTQRLLAVIRATEIPTIGFCGGHQLIARAYGSREAPMRRLRPGEKDPHPAYHPGYYKEWCFMPVRIVKPDPLFDGFRDEVVVREYHAFEVKKLPPEFELLASSDECRIQAMKHKTKLLYGTQFHPEHFDDQHPDGERIVANFFTIAGLRKKAQP
ncbi:MAG: gamma-glutamyl-gamma-aminobutyrate hydrolase family protein [Verrucomicrobiae bacterium]|nr:gamma-glutamyl-gamma-aminobutyrate hydrolase family protein [Verrucomicrobiae bacterium]